MPSLVRNNLTDFSPNFNVFVADIFADSFYSCDLVGSSSSHGVSLADIFATPYRRSRRFHTKQQRKLQCIRCKYLHQFIAILLIPHPTTVHFSQMSSLACATVSLADIFAASYQQSCQFFAKSYCIRYGYLHWFVAILPIPYSITMYPLQISCMYQHSNSSDSHWVMMCPP